MRKLWLLSVFALAILPSALLAQESFPPQPMSCYINTGTPANPTYVPCPQSSGGGGGVGTSATSGQAVIAATGTAVNLSTSATFTNGFTICALSTNTNPILMATSSSVTNVYDGTGNGFIRRPGECIGYSLSNTNKLWINGTAGDIVSFTGN